ncbi:hypothetical protein IFO70_17410 [Phormidium tenue FACHB-886]|nr:hypothetical protein [Phormidium tenue FACHB-886]
MIGDKPAKIQQNQPVKLRSQRNVSEAQEAIYEFLLEIVRTWQPEAVLTEFKGLFIYHKDSSSCSMAARLFEIVFSNQEQEFKNTLKRSCYILINNWEISRNYKAIHQLIELFTDPILHRPTISPTLKRLREWLRNFLESQDFQELRLFVARYDDREKRHWTDRYTSYLLVPQYTNLNNPVEQRQAARSLSKKLKEKFKFDLAKYTVLAQTTVAPGLAISRSPENPTGLGDEVLRLIKRIVAKRGFFSYPNLANIFLSQVQQLRYVEFKKSLLEYLLFSIGNPAFVDILRKNLAERLDALYVDHHDKVIDDALLLRTANRIIEYLTIEAQEEPTSLFVLLLSRSSPIALVVVFLKLILICPYARTHLEVHIAQLIRHYEKFPEADCQWVINFFEVFNITMTIYTENVEYNLVTMPPPVLPQAVSQQTSDSTLETCRIFSRSKPFLIEEDKAIDAFPPEKTAN